MPVGRRCAITSKPTASSGIASTAGQSMAMKAIPVPAAIAAAQCVGSSSLADRPFSVGNDSVERQEMSEQPGYQNILVERSGAVGIVTLNRPAALNALNASLISELAAALDSLEDDAAIGTIILTGNEKAFAAGADVKEMVAKSYPEIYCEDFITRRCEHIRQCRKTVVSAGAGV